MFLLNVDGLTAERLGQARLATSAKGAAWSSPRAICADASAYGQAAASSILPATLDEKKAAPPGHDLRPGRFRPSAVQSPSQAARPRTDGLAGLPLLERQAGRRLADDPQATPTATRPSSSGASRGPGPAMSCSGRPRWPERGLSRDETRRPGTSSRSRGPSSTSSRETIPYLAGTSGERLNYEAGQDAMLTLDAATVKASQLHRSGAGPQESPNKLAAPTELRTSC